MTKIGTSLLLIILLFISTHGLGQTDWTNLEYNPDVPNIEHNPLKGWMPGYKNIKSDFPYSTNHFYIRLNDVYKGWNEYDWTAFENELDRITSGGRHVVTRFWINYPNQSTGFPGFLSNDVPLYSDGSPNWNDEDLMRALEEFIAEFGRKYDGDVRIAMIEAGLYGKWGEWHTYPETERQMTQANKDRLLIAYKNAFDITHIGLRQSNHASTYELKMSVGYYDDSFAFNTLCTGGWCSWNGNILPDGITDNYQYHPFAGELRPEIQSTIFDAWPNGTSNGEEDLETCIRTTHLSFMKAMFLYANIPTTTEWENALRSHKMMGYEFFVDSVRLHADSTSNLTVDVKIQNKGVAPFYFNWEVEFAAIKSNGEFVGTFGQTDWDITTVLPNSGNHSRSFNAAIYGNDTYKILMRFVNPLEEITNKARHLRFANNVQDADREGWLTLGTVTIAADNVDVEDVKIGSCPADTLYVGTPHLLSYTVFPFNASNQNVSWSSSDTSVASVDMYGELRPLAAGSTIITLYNHDLTISDQCLVKVKEQDITVDELVGVGCPNQVAPGETVTLSVEYSATHDLDIRAFIQLNSPPWDTYGGNTITVPRSKGTLEIEFQVSETIPPANGAYKFVVNLLPVGKGWNERIDEIIVSNISALVDVNGISIDNCLESDLPKGGSHQLTASVTPGNANNQTINWRSSDNYVVTVNENGLLTGVNDGTAQIIATSNDGSFTDECTINVATIPVTGVSIGDCPASEMEAETNHQLTYSVVPGNATNQSVTWSSSNETIATIDEKGFITAVAKGLVTFTITSDDGGLIDVCEVNVIPVQVTGVAITGCPSENLLIGDYYQLTAIISPDNAQPQTVNWTSSDTLVVQVNTSGLLTAISSGSAVITATTENGTFTDDCTVWVADTTTVSSDFISTINEVKIFPNPTSGILYFEFAEKDVNRKVLIYNNTGQMVFSERIEKVNVMIDVRNFILSGFLFVQIQSADNVSTHKVAVLKNRCGL